YRGGVRQYDVASAIITVYNGFNIRPRRIGRRIHVGAETNDRYGFFNVRRNGSVNIAMLVKMSITNAHSQEFIDEEFAKVFWFLGGRTACRCWVGLGIYLYVAEEAHFGAGRRQIVY